MSKPTSIESFQEGLRERIDDDTENRIQNELNKTFDRNPDVSISICLTNRVSLHIYLRSHQHILIFPSLQKGDLMEIPGKSCLCHHHQVFCLKEFFNLDRTHYVKRSCPICKVNLTNFWWKLLMVDSFVSNIIQEASKIEHTKSVFVKRVLFKLDPNIRVKEEVSENDHRNIISSAFKEGKRSSFLHHYCMERGWNPGIIPAKHKLYHILQTEPKPQWLDFLPPEIEEQDKQK